MSRPKQFELKRNHGWKAKAGNAICVLDRGAVRFEFRRNWILKQRPDSVQIHDCEPPDDNCVLGVSHFPVPFDSSAVPLRELVTATVATTTGACADADASISCREASVIAYPRIGQRITDVRQQICQKPQ